MKIKQNKKRKKEIEKKERNKRRKERKSLVRYIVDVNASSYSCIWWNVKAKIHDQLWDITYSY